MSEKLPVIKKEDFEGQMEEKALAGMNKEERQLIDSLLKKIHKHSVTFENGLPIPDQNKPELLSFAVIADICKVTHPMGGMQILDNAAAGQYLSGPGTRDIYLNLVLFQIADLDPQNPLEAMLISQMVAVDTSIGKIMTCAMKQDQTYAGTELYLNLATKLQRTFLQQVETLQKMRGKGQQTVRVEHVTVNKGGQAIVGNMTKGGREL